jgi:hypothetical protein
MMRLYHRIMWKWHVWRAGYWLARDLEYWRQHARAAVRHANKFGG